MGLITCQDCKQKISDAAVTCIHCGRPMKREKAIEKAPAGSVGKCPACGSLNTFDVVEENRKVGGFAGALGARMGTRFRGEGRCNCRKCKHTWSFGANI